MFISTYSLDNQSHVIGVKISSQSQTEGVIQEPESVPDIVGYEIKNYKGIDIDTFPISDLELAPTCFIIDNYVVISSSLSGAKNIIDTQKGDQDSLAKRFVQDFGKDKILPSSIFASFLDFDSLIEKLMQTTVISTYKPLVPMFTQGAITEQKLDEVIDILDDIHSITMTGLMSEDETSESLIYIEIEGL